MVRVVGDYGEGFAICGAGDFDVRVVVSGASLLANAGQRALRYLHGRFLTRAFLTHSGFTRVFQSHFFIPERVQ